MTRRPYTYTILRYVHDPITGEFANVGAVVYFPPFEHSPAVLMSATRHTIGRIREMFPDLVRADFTSAMSSIDRSMKRLAAALGKETLLPTSGDALSFARRVLPADASSLQWSEVGSGVAENAEKALTRIYSRFVTRYDERAVGRRSDDEVWRPVRAELEQRNIPIELQKKTISSGDDAIDFSHAWKNGAWHAYEALSFDLADADGIAKKAHRWLGQLSSVAPQATEPFHTYFLVGKPTDAKLEPAYARAVNILRKAPSSEVYEESQVVDFVNRIEDEVRAHNAH